MLNNHRNHIKKAFCNCEITEHFLLNPRTHNFDNDVTITIIDQITRIDMTVERKREIFWQSRLKALQPSGLNKRIG